MLISPIDIIKASLELYKKNSAIFLKYAVLIFVPSFVLMLVQYSLSYFILLLGNALLAFSLYIFLTTVISLLTIWISLALTKDIAGLYTGQKIIFWDSMNKTITLFFPAFLITILTSLAILGGFILFIIPAVIFGIWFTFSLHALVLDQKHGAEALLASKKLVEKRWWKTFLRIVIPTLFFTLIIVILQWFLTLVLGIKNDVTLNLYTFTYITLIMIVSSFITPLASSVMTILYLELKKTPVKKELIDESLKK